MSILMTVVVVSKVSFGKCYACFSVNQMYNFHSLLFVYRLIVVLKEQIYIYDVNTLEIKRIIDTVPNLQGQFETSY